jgi:hypothetical protein
MTDDTRILTDDESRQRRAEQASSAPGRAVSLCAEPACRRAAHWGPWCDDHRPSTGPRLVTAELTNDEIAQIRAEVNAKAAPLFLIAMDWILRRQLAQEGVELPPVVAVVRKANP